MALNLARRNSLLSLLGFHRYIRNGTCYYYSPAEDPRPPRASWGSYPRTLMKESTLLQVPKCCTTSEKPFHSSVAFWKNPKLKESDYEMLRIVDPAGVYLCTAEMLVLEKFCHHYHRYTFQEVDKGEVNLKSLAAINDGLELRLFQLVDKRKDTGSPAEVKRMKTVKFHKDKTADVKLKKIFEALVDGWKVLVSFDKKATPIEKEVKLALQPFVKIKEMERGEDRVHFSATLDDVDSKLLMKLLREVQESKAKHLAEVKELLKVVGKV